ncbi:hypothetical protein Tco_1134303 [Tanacetum coccineum]
MTIGICVSREESDRDLQMDWRRLNGGEGQFMVDRGLGHLARNCTVRPRRRDAAYLQTQLLITQKEEAGIQLQDENFDLISVALDLDEIEEVNANCILVANLQRASTSVGGVGGRLVAKEERRVVRLEGVDRVRGEKHDPPAVHDSEETLQLAQESRLKMKQLNKEIKPANYTKINQLLGVFVSQMAKLHEELYFSNTSKTANVSKPISIPNEEFSDGYLHKVLHKKKFLNEVKSTIVTLQRVVKQKITLDIHNWSSSAHQEIHKIVKDEIFPIVNQADARVQNFEIQFLKEAAKFVRDFQSLAKEADESLAKHKALEFEIECLLRVVVSQDIKAIVHNPSVVDSSNLQTELERTKERFENCTIKKENEYAKLWNDWYKKCEECKYDKISYDKAYNDMQQKIERLQAQLGDQKGKSKDTPYVSNTLDPLSQKLENENAKLEAQLFDKVSEQKDTNKGTSMNTQFSKQSILEKPPSSSKPKLYSVTPFPKSTVIPKVDESNALSKPVTSNSAPSSRESTIVNNERVIAPGIFRINPFKTSRYVNGMKSRKKNQSANVSKSANQKKHKAQVWKPKNVGSKERFASPKPSKPRSCLRWSPTGILFDLKGKIIASSESESQSDCSKGDNACTSNPQEPISKRFPNSIFSMTDGQIGLILF